jgi:DNA-directed RNA polymerase subunit L
MGLLNMNIKVLSKTSRELVLEIEGEDHTLGNMLMKEALRHPLVEYAAYRTPHPLRSSIEFTIVVREGADLSSVLKDVISNLRSQITEFKSKIEDLLG